MMANSASPLVAMNTFDTEAAVVLMVVYRTWINRRIQQNVLRRTSGYKIHGLLPAAGSLPLFRVELYRSCRSPGVRRVRPLLDVTIRFYNPLT
ncbi:hypothetical protein J6590_003315 [Homalodisca vitripennis]|nr:hypothetical protein J6590_003315 [Homalodisca vitripennis]